MTYLLRIRAAWDEFFFRSVPAGDLCLGRLIFFSLAFLYYAPQDFAEWGTVSPEFWMPIALFRVLHLPLLDYSTLTVIQTIWKAALALAAVGLWTRPAIAGCFAGGMYLLGLPHNFGQTQHFDTLMVLIFGILAASRAGDAWSIDAWRRQRRSETAAVAARESAEYRWPIRAIWVTAALIFFAAGLSKLRHSGLEWIFSDHLAILLQRHQYYVSDGEPLTAWGPVIASYPWAARGLAAISILVETLYPLSLFSRRARYVLVPAGIGFLVGIRLLMGPTFEAFLICHVFWVRWEWVVHRATRAFRSATVFRQTSRHGWNDRASRRPSRSSLRLLADVPAVLQRAAVGGCSLRGVLPAASPHSGAHGEADGGGGVIDARRRSADPPSGDGDHRRRRPRIERRGGIGPIAGSVDRASGRGAGARLHRPVRRHRS
jgi:hypothetical protein